MAMRRRLTVTMVLMLALGGATAALAQDVGPSPDSPTKDRNADTTKSDGNATPQADDGPLPTAPDGPLDLAAMTLDSNELPAGYTLFNEAYVDLDQLEASYADIFDPGELAALGIVGYYETTYAAADGGSQFRSYVIEYPDVQAAKDGFDLLENEDRTVTGDADLQDEPGPAGVGEQPSEITTGTYGPAGAEQATVDITFRIDRLGVGVAMETFDGSDPDQDIVEGLAADAEARVAAALSGDDIRNVDPTLVERVVQLDGTTFEGYQTVVDGYGTADSVASDGFVASYVRGATFSKDTQTTIAPYVTIGVSSYEDADAALAVLTASDQIMPQFPGLENIAVPLVNGSPTVGYAFDSLIEGGDSDSVRLFVAVDDTLLSIDVQGFATTDDALDAALEIADAVGACADGGDCGPVGLPGGTGPNKNETPVSAPGDDKGDTL